MAARERTARGGGGTTHSLPPVLALSHHMASSLRSRHLAAGLADPMSCQQHAPRLGAVVPRLCGVGRPRIAAPAPATATAWPSAAPACSLRRPPCSARPHQLQPCAASAAAELPGSGKLLQTWRATGVGPRTATAAPRACTHAWAKRRARTVAQHPCTHRVLTQSPPSCKHAQCSTARTLCPVRPAVAPPDAAAPRPNVLFAKVRALLFFLWSFTLALPLFATMTAMAPFVLLFDKHRCRRVGSRWMRRGGDGGVCVYECVRVCGGGGLAWACRVMHACNG